MALENSLFHFYRTRVRSLAMLVTNSVRHSCLVNLMSGNDANCLMMSQQLKMPTQNLLRLFLLLMLMMRIVLATVCCRFKSWGLVIKLYFCSDFELKVCQDVEVKVQARFWSWSLVSILPLMFCAGYDVESWSRFWNYVWSLFWILSFGEMLMFDWDVEVDVESRF